MDGYFVVSPPPLVVHASYAPKATPLGNLYQVNHSVISNFWSVRDLWSDETWKSQSESSFASVLAQTQSYVPYVSMTPVVMLSW